jgi:hypothetical protein
MSLWWHFSFYVPQFFPPVAAAVSQVLFQKFHLPIHYLVPVGAVAEIAWRMVA